jgi:hypothetical protein
MKISTLTNYFIAAAAGGVAIIVRDATEASTSNVEGYAYAVIAAVAAFSLLTIASDVPSAFAFWRFFTREEQKFEGDWIETVQKDGNTFYSIFSIVYVWRKNQYVLSGIALDVDGKMHATWDSLHMEFTHDTFELKYLFRARQVAEETMMGYAEVSFIRPSSGRPSEGRGFYVDMAIEPIRVEYGVRRVDEKLKEELLGSGATALSDRLRQRFVKAYHNKYSG